jgi:uncharacterized protein (DUF1015 family)
LLRIKPFCALRPKPDLVPRVASVPFDVVTTEEARELAKNEPLSFLRVVRSELDLPEGTDLYGEEVYQRALANFRQLQEDGVLIREQQSCLYLYRQQTELFGKQVSQTGLVCCCHVDDYLNDAIKKHEITRKDKEDDRVRHVLTLDANAGPVFLLYPGSSDIDELVRDSMRADPIYDFTASDGVQHTVWRVDNTGPYVEAFRQIEAAYVADGHHRSAAAARAAVELRRRNPKHTGDEEYNWYLTVLFPAGQLNILPCQRVVKNLNGLSPEGFLQKLSEIGTVEEAARPEPEHDGCFGVYLRGKWYRVCLPADSIDRNDPERSLDYVLLYERILRPLLGIEDIRTDSRIDFAGGVHGTSKVVKMVDSGKWSVAFAVRAVSVNQLIAVADAGRIMPPKSTWFAPKLRSGLLIHTLS